MKWIYTIAVVLLMTSCKDQVSHQESAISSGQVAEVLPVPNDTLAKQDSSDNGNLSFASSGLNADTSDVNTEINLSSDYLFDFDKAQLKPEADAELAKVADVIKEKGKNIVLVTGYTDAIGKPDYNMQLSLKRADAVKSWFEKNGLESYDFKIEGKGAEDPIAPNTLDGKDNPEGRSKNRRVKIVIVKETSLNGKLVSSN